MTNCHLKIDNYCGIDELIFGFRRSVWTGNRRDLHCATTNVHLMSHTRHAMTQTTTWHSTDLPWALVVRWEQSNNSYAQH